MRFWQSSFSQRKCGMGFLDRIMFGPTRFSLQVRIPLRYEHVGIGSWSLHEVVDSSSAANSHYGIWNGNSQ